MKVYELMSALAKRAADADVVIGANGLFMSQITKVDEDSSDPEQVALWIDEPQYDES